MKIMISAGEASGDMHAGAIARELKKIDSSIEIFGMGGDELRQAGGEVLFDIKEHSVMGFWEVLKRLPKLFRLKKDFVRTMEERQPDCFVTVDYPGFNMRVAKIAHEKHIPVLCYIPPSAWAWNKGRAKKVAAFATKVAAVFPFEYDVYKEAGANTEFVGHPLVDIVKPTMTHEVACTHFGKREGHPLVLIMPGSRLMEIDKMMDILLAGAKLLQQAHPEIDFAMPRANTIPKELLEQKIKASGLQVQLVEGNNYDLFSVADLALATSGTVTLEAALLGLGSVIVYRTSWFNAFIAKLVLNIPFIGLPNIVAARGVLPELLQENFTAKKIAATASELLQPERYAVLKQDMNYVRQRLGEPGTVHRVAELILKTAKEQA